MPMMAHEGSEASVASSSPATNWWEMTTSATPLSWNTTAINHYRWLQPPHPPPSNSSADDDIISISPNSFTNMSNHSALTLDYSSSPAAEASGGCGGGDQTDNHLWMNQVLLGVESSGSHGDCGKFLELLSSKTTLPTEMFDPACDYLKKLDSSWEFASTSSSLNSSSTFDAKQLAGSSNGEGGSLIECEKLTSNLSDLVGNWSIAPPNNLQNNDQNSMIFPQVSPIKHDVLLPTNLPSYPNFDPYVKGDSRGDEMVGGRSCSFSTGFGLKSRYCGTGALMAEENPLMSAPRSNIISDLISFTSLNKPAMEFRAGKPSLRGPAASSESSRKQQFGHGTFSSATRGSGRGGGNASEGKKKRNEESSQTIFKKCRHDSSSTTTVLTHKAPKVKLGEKITALQQIVSPFGKTDTASVLMEAINYIRFLQEQVQLLSDPYLKSGGNKDHGSWGGLERKLEKGEAKLDLRSRGLCLVPISCTPQAYRDTTSPDYWTPAYRGCMYR